MLYTADSLCDNQLCGIWNFFRKSFADFASVAVSTALVLSSNISIFGFSAMLLQYISAASDRLIHWRHLAQYVYDTYQAFF